MTRTIAVISAGTGEPSTTRMLADRLGAATERSLRSATGGADVVLEVVDVRDLAGEIAHAHVSGLIGPALQRALDAVVGADGIVAVTPVYAASYSGLFKAFVDLLRPDQLRGAPVVVAATGGSERHSLVLDHAMRPLFSYLRAVVVPTGVYAATSDWGAGAGVADGGPGDRSGDGGLRARIERAGAELAEIVAARPPRSAPGLLATDEASFESLLFGS